MKKTILTVLALIPLCAAGLARADEQHGLSLGLRAAYALPFGDATTGQSLGGLTTGAAPGQLEIGWRFGDHWEAGAYFSCGSTFVGDDARNGLRAQGGSGVRGHTEQRIGLQGFYTLSRQGVLAPWVGLAAGLESTRYAKAQRADELDTVIGLSGVEAALQAGADWRIFRWFRAGPFLALHAGRYLSRLEWVEGGDERTSTNGSKANHGWFELGVRGSFDL